MLDFHNTLIVPAVGGPGAPQSRKDVILNRRFIFNRSSAGDLNTIEWNTVPIIIANMAVTGTIEVACATSVKEANISVALHKYYSAKDLMRISSTLTNFWVTFGLKEDISIYGADGKFAEGKPIEWTEEWALASYLRRPGAKICLDVANGYLSSFVDRVRLFKQLFPGSILMAGNVATAQGAVALATAGADIVKVGIGPGNLCKTRKVTGVGYPQLQAIVDIRNKFRDLGLRESKYICADGGISSPGDATKAFVCGADFVMLGSYFIGSNEIGTHGYGMASSFAAHKLGYESEYRAEEGEVREFTPKGTIGALLKELLGGIRSCCTYVGAKDISELKYAQIVKI